MDAQDKRTTTAPTPRGPRGDVRRLRDNGGATVAELREFLQEMRGRSPQEMLGVIAQSDLVRSTLVAAIGAVVLLVVLTVVPFAWGKAFPAEQSAKAPPAAQAPAQTPDKPAATTDQPAAADAKPGDDQPEAKPDDLLDKLGIGEQKTAAPDVNPLESKADDLLKGLDN